MKSIFTSQRSDLSAAERVHNWNNGRDVTEPTYRAMTLYRTPQGSWFLRQTEGPMQASGLGIVRSLPVSPGYVRAYLTEQGARDALEKYFPIEKPGC
jgi:hypothetical protein